MWPRMVQVMLGGWLLLSPLIFRIDSRDTALLAVHMASGAAVGILALLAIRQRFLHLATFFLGLWLIAYGYGVGGYPPAPAYRNLLILGALVAVLGIIPSDCLRPPRSWRKYYRSRAQRRTEVRQA
jgi:hypothetical protein